MADANSHGPLFDESFGNADHPHGGSYFDSGFSQGTIESAHGKLFDLFPAPNAPTAHGPRYDEGWRDMPAQIHGKLFDEQFASELAGTEHGDLFDVFRGGAHTRFVYDGVDTEGTVTQVNHDYATVQTDDGREVEVTLPQFLAYRSPSQDNASPSLPDSEQERQGNAHNDGGGRTDLDTAFKALTQQLDVAKVDHSGGYKVNLEHKDTALATDGHLCHNCADKVAKDWEGAKQGATATLKPTGRNAGACDSCGADLARPASEFVDGTEGSGRTATGSSDSAAGGAESSTGSDSTGKSLTDALDVLKAQAFTSQHRVLPENVSALDKGTPVQFNHLGTVGAGTITKPNSTPGLHRVNVSQSWHPSTGFGKLRGTHELPHGSITHAQTMAAKSVSSALDVLKEVTSGETATQKQDLDGKPHWCPKCKHTCSKPDANGKCPECGTKTTVAKTASDGSEIPVQQQGTSQGHEPRTCPHCGLDLLDAQTEQGQPSRKDKQGGDTHKCVAGALNVLKEAIDSGEDGPQATPPGCSGCGALLQKLPNGTRFCANCGRQEDDKPSTKGAIPLSEHPDQIGGDSR
jgi:Zn finger protein HypA/HybF involved in hydrogenase expression